MKLPKSWTTVTPFSKFLALVLFISLPIISFLFGMQYQNILNSNQNNSESQQIIPTQAIKITPISIPSPTQKIKATPTIGAIGYTCPQNGWVNCMPILNEEGKKRCSSEAMKWYKSNCPNFKGGAM